jgi:hypothetical protein
MERCKWCGKHHEKFQEEVYPGYRVKLHSPFFQHREGDVVLRVEKTNLGTVILRNGTSGIERTPLGCVKEIVRE